MWSMTVAWAGEGRYGISSAVVIDVSALGGHRQTLVPRQSSNLGLDQKCLLADRALRGTSWTGSRCLLLQHARFTTSDSGICGFQN